MTKTKIQSIIFVLVLFFSFANFAFAELENPEISQICIENGKTTDNDCDVFLNLLAVYKSNYKSYEDCNSKSPDTDPATCALAFPTVPVVMPPKATGVTEECYAADISDEAECQKYLQSKSSPAGTFQGFDSCMSVKKDEPFCCKAYPAQEICKSLPTAGAGSGSGTGSTGQSAAGSNGVCGSPDLEQVNGICVPKTTNTGFAATKTIQDLLVKVIRAALAFAGVAAVLYLIYGGYLYITSGGNEEQAEKGQKALTNAIIGVVIIIMSYTIINVIVKALNT